MSKFLKTAICLAVAATTFTTLAYAVDDAIKVAPNTYKVVLENDRVRMLEAIVKPGETVPFHSHPDYSVYVAEGGTARFFSSPADTGVVMEMKTGTSSWHDAEVHSVKNIGKNSIHVVLTELKEPKPPVMKKDGEK